MERSFESLRQIRLGAVVVSGGCTPEWLKWEIKGYIFNFFGVVDFSHHLKTYRSQKNVTRQLKSIWAF